jgi:hypothetical protein
MTTSTEKSYFDLHITGIGYLNRIRDVKPKKGDAFLACDIAALNGPSEKPECVSTCAYRVQRSAAPGAPLRFRPSRPRSKVLIGFRLGDLWTDIFTYTKGKNEGEPGVSLKARLLFVSWIKVDGQLVYKAEPKPPRTDASRRNARRFERARGAACTRIRGSGPRRDRHRRHPIGAGRVVLTRKAPLRGLVFSFPPSSRRSSEVGVSRFFIIVRS